MEATGTRGETARWLAVPWVLGYFGVYLAYLFYALEGELGHWMSLVIIPALGAWWLTRRAGLRLGPRAVLRRLGLRWPDRGRGFGLAIVLVIAVQGIQLMNGNQREALAGVLGSSDALWIVPSAFLMMVVMAGFTEEFFFRGIFQRALTERFGSIVLAIALTSVAFSLYHVPYAYLNANWPSAGNLPHAFGLAFINGVMGGVILGIVFVRSGSSLLPPILVHAAVNWIPGMRLLSEQLRFGDG